MNSLIVLYMVLVAASAQKCEKTDLSPNFYDDKVPYGSKSYKGNREAEAALVKAIGEKAVDNMKLAAVCKNPVSVKPYWPQATVCEPCPHRDYILQSFCHNRCFVIFPQYQRVRYVRCTYRSCTQFCPCQHAYCRTTSWHMSWFFAYCNMNGCGWHKGFNYHYLWLPQDCKCRAYYWPEVNDSKQVEYSKKETA